MADQQMKAVPPSAPPADFCPSSPPADFCPSSPPADFCPSLPSADFCPSSPPPSYSSSPTTLRSKDNSGIQQQKKNTAKTNILPSPKNAKNAGKMGDAGTIDESFQQNSATMVVPMATDKVTILCLGHNVKCCRLSDRFATFQSVSAGRRNSGNKMRKLLALGCCAFSLIIFGFFAFSFAFIVIVLVDSQSTENNDVFDRQQQMRMLFGQHFG